MGMRSVAGVRQESGELYVLTDTVAIKVRGGKRRHEEDRRNQEEFAAVEGLPWEPAPGGIEVKAQHRDKEHEELVAKATQFRE